MKRDPDLIGQILLDAETKPPGQPLSHGDYRGNERLPEVAEHARLLIGGGYAEGDASKSRVGAFVIHRHTMEGYDLIDSIRDREVWAQVKNE
jgi:hypothetical protein